MSENNIGAQPAQVGGQASVIRAKPSVMTAVIQVTRAATGKVEEYTITGTLEPEQQKEA